MWFRTNFKKNNKIIIIITITSTHKHGRGNGGDLTSLIIGTINFGHQIMHCGIAQNYNIAFHTSFFGGFIMKKILKRKPITLEAQQFLQNILNYWGGKLLIKWCQ